MLTLPNKTRLSRANSRADLVHQRLPSSWDFMREMITLTSSNTCTSVRGSKGKYQAQEGSPHNHCPGTRQCVTKVKRNISQSGIHVNVIFRPYELKSTVIICYFLSLKTEIYKHMYAIFHPHGWKSTAKFRYFPSALLLFYTPKHYTPFLILPPK